MNISVLGSTGSIGIQTLDVAEKLGIGISAITVNKNIELAEIQARKFKPELVAVKDEMLGIALKKRLSDTKIDVLCGESGIVEAAKIDGVDTVVMAIMGIAALNPSLAALNAKKNLALANKETIVCAGDIMLKTAKDNGVRILPVDSEHSAIFQCLEGCKDRSEVQSIILTASGGPFFGRSRVELESVTLKDALKHPNWSMGAKITVDSASMMNKGLEIIEAMYLYDVEVEKIQAVVHRESIIHSLVEFVDNSVIAQLGVPDMRLPIQYAITWPKRLASPIQRLDLTSIGKLSFYNADEETFRCLKLAKQAAKVKGNACTVLNSANEAAVDLFLKEKIKFTEIDMLIENALNEVKYQKINDITDIFEADRLARQSVYNKKG